MTPWLYKPGLTYAKCLPTPQQHGHAHVTTPGKLPWNKMHGDGLNHPEVGRTTDTVKQTCQTASLKQVLPIAERDVWERVATLRQGWP